MTDSPTAAEDAALDILTLMRRARGHRVLCACLPCAEAKATLDELEDGEIDRLVGEASAERVAWLVETYRAPAPGTAESR